MPGAVADGADRQHHRHFDEDADHTGQGGAGLGSEDGDGNGYRQFEEIAGADQRPQAGPKS